MLCPKCKFEQNESNLECPQCGIIFSKYQAHKQRQNESIDDDANNMVHKTVEEPRNRQLKQLLCSSFGEVKYITLGGRVLVFIVILIWGMKFIFSSINGNYAGNSFIHLINLPFHEAGHILFRPFGSFIKSLGGTLGQMMMPLICLCTLLLKTRDAFGASICLWWFGQNFFDIAPYINDARAGILPLLGGNLGKSSPYGFHDWEYLLTESGLLQYDHLIAKLAVVCGTIIMILSFIWGGYILFLQYKECK